MALSNTDVSKPTIWFLKPGRSWDPAGRTHYQYVAGIDCVQPVDLEPYFRSLMSKGPFLGLAACLQSKDVHVVLRTLDHIIRRTALADATS